MKMKEDKKEKKKPIDLFETSIKLGDIEIITCLKEPLKAPKDILDLFKLALQDQDIKEYLRDFTIKKKLNGGAYVG